VNAGGKKGGSAGKKKNKEEKAGKQCPEDAFGPECSNCYEDNTAYFGNNAVSGHENMLASARACARSCMEHKDCKYWTWGKGSPEGPCYLKTKRENVRSGLPSYISGTRECKDLPNFEGGEEKEESGNGKGYTPPTYKEIEYYSSSFGGRS